MFTLCTLLGVQSWVRFCQQEFGEFPRQVGRYCSYLLPKQAGRTPQILLFKTLRMTGRPTVYSSGAQSMLTYGLKKLYQVAREVSYNDFDVKQEAFCRYTDKCGICFVIIKQSFGQCQSDFHEVPNWGRSGAGLTTRKYSEFWQKRQQEVFHQSPRLAHLGKASLTRGNSVAAKCWLYKILGYIKTSRLTSYTSRPRSISERHRRENVFSGTENEHDMMFFFNAAMVSSVFFFPLPLFVAGLHWKWICC